MAADGVVVVAEDDAHDEPWHRERTADRDVRPRVVGAVERLDIGERRRREGEVGRHVRKTLDAPAEEQLAGEGVPFPSRNCAQVPFALFLKIRRAPSPPSETPPFSVMYGPGEFSPP